MKSSGLLLPKVLLVWLTLFILQIGCQKDICTGEDGCIFAVKEYIYLPINDKSGKRDSFAESFDMKIMLAYSDRLIFFETSQTPLFQRELPPGKWLRTIYYNEISLECGEDGNKMCFAGELERRAPKFKILPQVLKGIKDAEKMCFAAPLIDNTERPPETSALYICSNNEALMRDFFRMRDKISRWADTYQMRIVEEEHSALNAVLRKAESFKYYSDDGKELVVNLQLYFQKIRAYIDPNNFLTKVFEFGLKQIKEKDGVQTVDKALELKILPKGVWEQFKTTHSVSVSEKCCLSFPLKKGGVLKQERNLFVCSASEKECEKGALNWATTLNVYIGRVKYLDNYEVLLNYGDNLKCNDDFPELEPMKKRLKNIANFQDEMCKRISLTAVTNQAKACSKDKIDDVTEELRMLSKYNKGIQTALENCIKFRVVDIFTMRFSEKTGRDKKSIVQKKLQF